MDVRAENRGRPRQKVRFSAVPVMGRNSLTQGRPGVRVRNVRGKSAPKTLCLCCFSSLTFRETKAFSSRRGLFFTVKGPRALPKLRTNNPPPSPSPQGGLLRIPVGGLPKERRGGGVCVEFGERARPLYREKKAPLGFSMKAPWFPTVPDWKIDGGTSRKLGV